MEVTFATVLAALRGQRLELHNEKVLQLQLAERFEACGLVLQREKILDAQNTIDFHTPEGFGIEVKIGGSKKNIYRQCERYCALPTITQLLLVTSKQLGFPPLINGKPTRVFSLGMAWLG